MRNLSRAQIEQSSGFVLQETDDAVLMRCLDDYSVWGLKDDCSLTPNIAAVGYWESWVTSWFTQNINDGDLVLDIGANCGYYTMLFERLVGTTGAVIAYEANPTYGALLEDTKTFNNASFEIRNVAVSDSVGEATLTFPGIYTGSASISIGFDPKYGEQTSMTVPTVSLDSEFQHASRVPNVVKVDAEGAEELIWNGGKTLWNAEESPVVVLEYTPGAYSSSFNDELFEYGSVNKVTYDGLEGVVTRNYLETLTDWSMLVIRRWK